MIVVLDTNIVASATYWRGKPAHCLEAWALGKYELAISHPILTEYEEVIARLAARYPTKQPTDWLSAIKQAAHLFLPVSRPAATPPRPIPMMKSSFNAPLKRGLTIW